MRNILVQKVHGLKCPGQECPGAKRPGPKSLGVKCPGPKSPGVKRPGLKRPGALTQSHLNPKVTVRQLFGYHKIESIYVKTMLLFKVIWGMAIILNSYGRKRYAVVRI